MSEPLTGERLVDFLLFAASLVTAVGALGAAAWWLLWPRVEDKLSELAAGLGRVEGELIDDTAGTVSRNAKVAAGAAAELPAIREQLDQLASAQHDIGRWRQGVDTQLRKVDTRLGSVEGVMVALAGPELRRRLLTDSTHTDERPST